MSLPITYIEQKLQAIVAPKLRVAPEQVPLDKSLLEDLNLDSFDLMTVILEIEEAFTPVTISDKSAGELLTLRELAAYIDKEVSLAPTPQRAPTRGATTFWTAKED
jgi:acyl carrier protein